MREPIRGVLLRRPRPIFCGTFLGGTGTSGDTVTTSIDVGAASPDRFIIAGAGSQNGSTLTALSVNGVSLFPLSASSGRVAIGAAIVSSGDGNVTISGTWTSSGFTSRGFTIWRLPRVGSTVAINTASGSTTASISVSFGEFLFAVILPTTEANFLASSEPPIAHHQTPSAGSRVLSSAEWARVGTQSSFSVTASQAQTVVAATFR